jgi:hypothetical protein
LPLGFAQLIKSSAKIKKLFAVLTDADGDFLSNEKIAA